MNKMVVACVQQRIRLHADMEECRKDLTRFLRTAQAKKAKLIVFPELIGTLAVSPLLQGLRARLLRQADQARRPRASLWTRVLRIPQLPGMVSGLSSPMSPASTA